MIFWELLIILEFLWNFQKICFFPPWFLALRKTEKSKKNNAGLILFFFCFFSFFGGPKTTKKKSKFSENFTEILEFWGVPKKSFLGDSNAGKCLKTAKTHIFSILTGRMSSLWPFAGKFRSPKSQLQGTQTQEKKIAKRLKFHRNSEILGSSRKMIFMHFKYGKLLKTVKNHQFPLFFLFEIRAFELKSDVSRRKVFKKMFFHQKPKYFGSRIHFRHNLAKSGYELSSYDQFL